jgi:hypothetical protein
MFRKILKNYASKRQKNTSAIFASLSVATMVRPPPVPKILSCSGSHVNVGEWVEVEHCYSVGTCSGGGIAIVTKFQDGKADVRLSNFALSLKR